ncbi:MAG: hotdog fold thioesterase [Bacteroidota bacterium]
MKEALEKINSMSKNTLGEHIGLEFTHIENGLVKGKVPVDHRTVQPYGVLHGGISAVLAETLGSVGSHMLVLDKDQKAFGIEITSQHLRPVREGFIYGEARIIHQGKTMHTWQIDICNDQDKLISISKLIVAIR